MKQTAAQQGVAQQKKNGDDNVGDNVDYESDGGSDGGIDGNGVEVCR